MPRCLASAAPLVNRILLGDTGSVDDTCALARSLGAEVTKLPWAEDFAAARNRLLAQARCDWVLVLDADEMLDLEQARAELPALLAAPGLHAYGLWRWNYLGVKAPAHALLKAKPNPGHLAEARVYATFLPSFHLRLFRRHPGIRFQHCVHEDISGSLDRPGLKRAIAPLVIHHFGYVEESPEQRRRKVELYRKLGLRRLEAAPSDFESHLQLGISELQLWRRPGEAAAWLEQAARLRPGDSRAALYLGICMLRLQRLEKAKQLLLHAQELGECNGALYDALGDVHLSQEDYAAAAASYRRAAQGVCDPSMVLAKCGLAEVHLGHTAEGLARIHAAVVQHPASAPLQALLGFATTAIACRELESV